MMSEPSIRGALRLFGRTFPPARPVAAFDIRDEPVQ